MAFVGRTPEQLAAHKAQMRAKLEQVADLLNEMQTAGSTVALDPRGIITDGGTLRSASGRFQVRDRW